MSKEGGRNYGRERNLMMRVTPGGGLWRLGSSVGNLGLHSSKCERGIR